LLEKKAIAVGSSLVCGALKAETGSLQVGQEELPEAGATLKGQLPSKVLSGLVPALQGELSC